MNKTVSVPRWTFAGLLCLIVALALLLGACHDPAESESGSITIAIGVSPTARWSDPKPTEDFLKNSVTHVIELRNGSGYANLYKTITLNPGVTSHTVTGVPLGALKVIVSAKVNGYNYAYGEKEITVAGGQNSAPVTMERLDYGIVLSEKPGSTHTFAALAQGYSSTTPLTVTVHNYAEEDTGSLTVALTGTGSGDFILGDASIANIAQDGSDTFYVRPVTGLAVGTYTATVSVTGNNDIDAFFTVSFTVVPETFNVYDEATLRRVGTETATGGWTLSASYQQIANITLTSDWTPIGSAYNDFTGSYNGNGHTISGLTINNANDDYQGLFGTIRDSAIVENVGIIGCSITGRERVGGVVGNNNRGTVQNCYVTGSVSGTTFVGGVVGVNFSTVQNCYVTGSVSGTNNVGGVVGLNDNSVTVVKNCVALCPSIVGSSNNGRIVGGPNGTITNNYGWSDITGGSWTSNLNGKDGADVSAAQYNNRTWWETTSGLGWDFTDVWEWNSATNLPKLRVLGGQ